MTVLLMSLSQTVITDATTSASLSSILGWCSNPSDPEPTFRLLTHARGARSYLAVFSDACTVVFAHGPLIDDALLLQHPLARGVAHLPAFRIVPIVFTMRPDVAKVVLPTMFNTTPTPPSHTPESCAFWDDVVAIVEASHTLPPLVPCAQAGPSTISLPSMPAEGVHPWDRDLGSLVKAYAFHHPITPPCVRLDVLGRTLDNDAVPSPISVRMHLHDAHMPIAKVQEATHRAEMALAAWLDAKMAAPGCPFPILEQVRQSYGLDLPRQRFHANPQRKPLVLLTLHRFATETPSAHQRVQHTATYTTANAW